MTIQTLINRVFRLPFLVLTVWASWLALLALMAVMVAARVWHPHFLPLTTVVGVFLVAGGALIFGALRRLVRGPGRLRTLTCLLLGMVPLLFMGGYFLYGLKAGYGRRLVVDLPLKLLIPLGESVLDLAARFRYPNRTGGETVVMISSPMGDAREQVAAMDRHVRALRERLGGRTTRLRVHWVRGPLLGIDGKAIDGVCLGTLPGAAPPDGEGLTYIDRHEVAHCVLSSLAPPSRIDPPALLIEGWAEANSGTSEVGLSTNAWHMRREGQTRSLRELTGLDWYSLHQHPVYFQGAPLVNYILRVYGPDKFLELYTTCHQPTFAEDCRRVLGVSLDELDRAYWADIDRAAGPAALLEHLKVRPPVEPVAWKAFLNDYLAEAARLVRPYENVELTGTSRFDGKTTDGKPHTTAQQFAYRRSGANYSLIVRSPDSEDALLATPAQSFEAHRREKNAAWEVEDRLDATSINSYRRVVSMIEDRVFVSQAAVSLLALSAGLRERKDTSHVVVTELRRFTEGGRRCVRVRLDDESPLGQVPWRSHTFVMDADHHLAAHSEVLVFGNGTTIRIENTYEIREGLPVFLTDHVIVTGKEGVESEGRTTILERRFGPIPDSAFSRERLLDGPVIVHPAVAVTDDRALFQDPVTFADGYGLLLVASAVAFIGGLATGLLGGFRR